MHEADHAGVVLPQEGGQRGGEGRGVRQIARPAQMPLGRLAGKPRLFEALFIAPIEDQLVRRGQGDRHLAADPGGCARDQHGGRGHGRL